jgi:hypothetical protein
MVPLRVRASVSQVRPTRGFLQQQQAAGCPHPASGGKWLCDSLCQTVWNRTFFSFSESISFCVFTVFGQPAHSQCVTSRCKRHPHTTAERTWRRWKRCSQTARVPFVARQARCRGRHEVWAQEGRSQRRRHLFQNQHESTPSPLAARVEQRQRPEPARADVSSGHGRMRTCHGCSCFRVLQR